MIECKSGDVLIDANHKFGLSKKGKVIDRVRYQSLVGKLIYLSHTRLDIAFSISVMIQHMHSPSEEHRDSIQDPKVLKEDTKQRIGIQKMWTINDRSLHECWLSKFHPQVCWEERCDLEK